jgi:uncharacterized membrane protein (DUF4010 family)
MTGALGGMISSTAITTSLSAQSKKGFKNPNLYVFGIVIAGVMMFPRVLIEVWILNKSLLEGIVPPILACMAVGLLASYVLWKRKDDSDSKPRVEFSSPFTFGPAIKFGIFFTSVLFLTTAGQELLGEKAIYGVSALSGLADVDAITVSASNLSKSGEIASDVATIAILIGIAANTFFKAFIVLFMGSRQVAKKVGWIFFLMILAGAITVFMS